MNNKLSNEAINAAIKATEYKYFGYYEFSDKQHEAVDVLVSAAREALEYRESGSKPVAWMRKCITLEDQVTCNTAELHDWNKFNEIYGNTDVITPLYASPVLSPQLTPGIILECMQDNWNEWCADTDSFPPDFSWRGGSGALSFEPSSWAVRVAQSIMKYTSPVLSQLVPDELPEPQDSCAGYYRDGWNDCRAAVLSASPVLGQTLNNDDKKDAERWRFIRKFLAVEDIDGSLDGEAMHVLCIKESAFESSMIGFPRDVSIEVAIDAAMAKATGESE